MKRMRLLSTSALIMATMASLAAQASADETGLNLQAIASLQERLNTYDQKLPDLPKLGISKALAYEENEQFTYIMGKTPVSLRRIFFIKPATLIISDVLDKTPDKPARWLLGVTKTPKIDARKITFTQGKTTGFCETILPHQAEWKPAKQAAAATAKHNHSRIFVHMLHLAGKAKTTAPVTKLIGDGHVPRLSITLGQAVWDIILPPEQSAPGTIAITDPDAKKSVARRLLPSGILPHGEKIVAMMKRWDRAYHNNKRPGWDSGRVAFELRKVVENGTIKPCRAVILGCGTGTNAEYLAGKGFEVTAIDISPTCLTMAQKKSEVSGSGVKWVLADVLAPPKIPPFDFIFDRGCYHNIRKHNAADFVKASKKMSKPGTKFMLLAGSAAEKKHWGPPRIKESEIREDFSPSFKIDSMKQSWFDLNRKAHSTKGPMAWCVIMTRK
ncbi:MAG: methyltransferase domain-containing protein [Phycisphaerales bacterium]|jgi:methyl halide transferase|nr:methyltransferase domain-containing protein [Phycisphaerales bacterium]